MASPKQKNLIAPLKGLRGSNALPVVLFEATWSIPYGLYSFYLSLYMKSQGVTDVQIGFLISLNFIVGTVTALFAGVVADKLGRRKGCVIFSVLSWPGAVLLNLRARGFWGFAFAQTVCAFGKISDISWQLTTIEDAIIQAGGLLESASTAKVDLSRRIKNPSSTDVSDTLSYTFTYTIKDGFIVGGDEVVLQPYDRIYVRKSPSYNVQNHVTVSGEVVYPGLYALSQRESRLSDLVAEAGGATKWAYVRGAKLVRKMTAEERAIVEATLKALGNAKGAIEGLVDPAESEYTVGINLAAALENPGTDADVVLRDGDRLIVPEYTNTVKISGNVMYPNVVTFNHKMNVKKYVTMAGGYGYKAKKSKAYVVYMNGTVAKAKGCSKKVIEPGCEIIVPTKIKDPSVLPTIMSIVSATSSTASMLSTIYALINSATK